MERSTLVPILVVLCLSAAPGWAWKTKAHLEDILNSGIGKSMDHLVHVWGIPASTYTFKDGSKEITYHQASTTSAILPVSSYYSGPRPVLNSTYYCNVTLQIGPDDIMTGWKLDGNDCKADKPKAQTGRESSVSR